MWWVVDRIEGRFAVLVSDAGEQIVLPKKSFREGRVYRHAGYGRLVRDTAEERRRLRDARARLERLAARDPGGDITIR